MDFKKFAFGLIIVGILVAAIGTFGYFLAKQKAVDYNWRTSVLAIESGTESPPMKSIESLLKTYLPIILVGGGIFILGLLIKFSIKSEHTKK
jgi:hypothetical protein